MPRFGIRAPFDGWILPNLNFDAAPSAAVASVYKGGIKVVYLAMLAGDPRWQNQA